MLKGNKLYSILYNKCPQCHEGDFFKTKSAFDLKHFDEMHDHCSVCGMRYEREPGFYTGSMYVSYAFYVATIVSSFVLFVVIFDMDALNLLYGLIPALILLTPYYFRLARRVWINMFVGYNPAHGHETESNSLH